MTEEVKNQVKITPEGFVWKVLKPQEALNLWGVMPLFILYDDGSESLIDSEVILKTCIRYKYKIGLEVGFIPQKLLEEDFHFVEGDSTEFEIWAHNNTGKAFKVPTEIVRDWDKAKEVN